MSKELAQQTFERNLARFKRDNPSLLRDVYQLEQELGVPKKSFRPLEANLEDLELKIEEDKVLYAKQLKQLGYSPSRVYEIIYGHMYGQRDLDGTGSAFERIPYDFRNVYTADEILHYFPENVLEKVYGKRALEQALYKQRAATFQQAEMRKKLKKGVNAWANARDEDEEVRMFSRLPEQSPEKMETDISLQEMVRKREEDQMIQQYLRYNPAALQKKEQVERDYPQYLLQNPEFAQQVREEQQQRFGGGGRRNKKLRSKSRSKSRSKTRSKSRSKPRSLKKH